jgi:hypothetical protein
VLERGAVFHHGSAAPLLNDAVGERQHELEIGLDDDDRGVTAVKHLEQLEHDGGGEALSRPHRP